MWKDFAWVVVGAACTFLIVVLIGLLRAQQRQPVQWAAAACLTDQERDALVELRTHPDVALVQRGGTEYGGGLSLE